MIGFGVLAGAGKPDEAAEVDLVAKLAKVGTSGQPAIRFGAATASARTLPSSTSGLACE